MPTLESIRDFVWGPFLLTLLLGSGVFLTAACGVPQFQLRRIWKSTFGSLKSGGRRSLDAMLTALGGTIGTGNIVGVSVALTAGGAGALLWMALAALVGMATKYAEIHLAVRYRVRKEDQWRGGPMYTLRDGLHAPRMARLFAALCVLTSLGIGNTVQASAAADALREGFGLSGVYTGLALALLCGCTLLGSADRVARVNSRLVPAMGVLYVVGAVVCVLTRLDSLPDAVASVFTGAFAGQSAAGGVAGYTVAQAARFGVARGLFTNEAGMGSAPIAHAAAEGADPTRQGRWGVVEVGLDTLLMCTLTGLVLLTADPAELTGTQGFARTLAAFRCGLGPLAGGFLCASMFCFAFASMLAWAFYGECALEFLTGGRGRNAYVLVFALGALLGAVADPNLLWICADLCNAAMCLPNLAGTVLLWGKETFFRRKLQQTAM